MARRNRIAAIALLCVLTLVILSSVACIAVNASHDCVSANCRICAQLLTAGNVLRQLGSACLLLALALAALERVFAAVRTLATAADAGWTLVSLKVKLSD